MRELIYTACLGFVSLFGLGHMEQCTASEEAELHTHETSFVVSTQNLYFDNDEMMVVIDDHSFPVQALQRSGNQWRVQVASAGYCQMGHNLCGGCQLCHRQGCIYYVRHCKLWNLK